MIATGWPGGDCAPRRDPPQDPVRRILVPALVIAALFGGLVAGARWRELTGGSESLREREPVHAAGAPAPERTGGRTQVNPTVRCPDCCTPQPPPAGGARDDARKTPEEVEERR